MVFKTVPNIVKGNGKPEDLHGKEVVAHLMMRYDLASNIDKYKFMIDSDIYNKLLFENLRSMNRAEGWKWKKTQAIKLDKYGKLIDELKSELACDMCMSINEIDEYYIFIREFAEDTKFRKILVDKFIELNDIQEIKKKDKLYKKYDIKIQQQSLF